MICSNQPKSGKKSSSSVKNKISLLFANKSINAEMAPGVHDDDESDEPPVDSEELNRVAELKRKRDPDWDPNQPKKKRRKLKKKTKVQRKKNFRDKETKISDKTWLQWLRNAEDLSRNPL